MRDEFVRIHVQRRRIITKVILRSGAIRIHNLPFQMHKSKCVSYKYVAIENSMLQFDFGVNANIISQCIRSEENVLDFVFLYFNQEDYNAFPMVKNVINTTRIERFSLQ